MKNFRAVSAALAAFCLLVACSREAGEADPARAANTPLIVIGIDGATWDVIDPMIEAGELPNFARLKATGAWGPLITVGPQVSPVVWTTFGTGHFGRQHGILDFTYPFRKGPGRAVQSTERQVPALWNRVSHAGGKVAVVGYFVTYPAEPVNGAIVSYKSPQQQPGADFPPDVLAPIRADLDEVMREDQDTYWRRYLPWNFDPKKPPPEGTPEAEAFRMVSGRVERRILQAEYNRRAALYLADGSQDLFVAYFGIVDHASHALWKFYDDRDYRSKPTPELKRLLGNAVPESYRYMDEFIGDMLEAAPPNANLVVISDHGFGSATGRFRVAEHNRDLLTGNHRPNGIFLAAGPDIETGRLDGLTIMDVFPALAYLAGLPVADDLPGDLRTDVFTRQRLESYPPEFVRAYPARDVSALALEAVSDEAGEDNIKTLQGLGYVGEGFEYADAQTTEFDFWASKPDLIIQHLVGELSYHLLKEDEVSATEVLVLAAAHDATLNPKIVQRTQRSLETIRERVGDAAIPESATRFLDAYRP